MKKIKNKALCILFLILLPSLLVAQSHFQPNFSLKSPATLDLINFEISDIATTVVLSLENKIEGGYFCINTNTYVLTDDGDKYKLESIKNLPLCPNNYKFKKVNETKIFTLVFPPLTTAPKWIDIVEDCESNCMGIYGICLEQELNSEINSCFIDIEKGRTLDAINKFEALRTKLKDSKNPILGPVYLNLIALYNQTGQKLKATQLKTELESLVLAHKEKFLKIKGGLITEY